MLNLCFFDIYLNILLSTITSSSIWISDLFIEYKNRVDKETALNVNIFKEKTTTNILFNILTSCNVSLY